MFKTIREGIRGLLGRKEVVEVKEYIWVGRDQTLAQRREKIRSMFERGFGDAEIAFVVKMSSTSVRNARQKMGLLRRNGRPHKNKELVSLKKLVVKSRGRSRKHQLVVCAECGIGKTYPRFVAKRRKYCSHKCCGKATARNYWAGKRRIRVANFYKKLGQEAGTL